VGYQKGAAIKDTVNILVRVSPVNADFSSYQEGDILIVNSQGQALDDYLTVGRPKKYGDVLSYTGTRATKIGSGLWLIPVTMKRGVTIKDYMLATHPDAKLNSADEIADKGRETLYAVAIRNTQKNGTASTQRYAVSTYDLVSSYEDYKPATIFTFQVNDTDVEDIYNRWTLDASGNGYIHAEETKTESKKESMWMQKLNEKAAVPATYFDRSRSDEAKFKSFNQPVNIAGIKQITSLGTPRYEERYINYQYATDGTSKPQIIKAEVGEPIYISNFIGGRPQTGSDGVVKTGQYEETRLDYYYVVLDSIGALESGVTEMNTWLYAYKYEGLNKVYKIGEKCAIKVVSDVAKTDIIGFRVYACNMDGTLADPDGRAFYVQIDKKTEHGNTKPLDGQTANNIVAKMASTSTGGTGYTNTSLAYNFGIFEVTPQSGGWVDFAFDTTIPGGTLANSIRVGTNTPYTGIFNASNGGTVTLLKDDYPNLLNADLTIKYWLVKELSDDKKAPKVYATRWSEVKYIAIAVDNIENWVDASTIDFTLVGYENNTANNYLDVSICKKMPGKDDIPDAYQVRWYPDKLPNGSTLNVYPYPSDIDGNETTNLWKASAAATTPITYAAADVSGYSPASPSSDYKWVIKGAGVNPTDISLSDLTSSIAVIPVGNIGHSYDATIYYRFPGISLVNSTSTAEAYDAPAWPGKIAFGNPIDLLKYKSNTYTYLDGTNTVTGTDYFICWNDFTDESATTPLAATLYGYDSAAEKTALNPTKPIGDIKLSTMVKCNSTNIELSQASSAKVEGVTGSLEFAVDNVLPNYVITSNSVTLTGYAAVYLKVRYDETNKKVLIYKASSTVQKPTDNWKGSITVKGTDALGNVHTIVDNFEFTLLYNR
jgi:hypothetical protein